MAPVKGAFPSVNRGNCGLPLASVVTVAVAAAEVTVVPGPALRTCRTVPDGLENCRPWLPSAALSWLTTAPMPPEKFTPITVAFGLDDGGSGSAPGSSTRTIVTLCGAFVASVNATVMVLPGRRL